MNKGLSYFIITILLIGAGACQQQPMPHHANYYEQCDTTTNRSWLQQQLKNLQNQPQQRFQNDAETLLNALQKNQLNIAKQYATKRGLGTLLYLNAEQIEHYEISDMQISKKTAVAYIKINHTEKPIRFKFALTDSLWQFQGIATEDLNKGTPHLIP
jgi:small-conductance mechanosensitive channel